MLLPKSPAIASTRSQFNRRRTRPSIRLHPPVGGTTRAVPATVDRRAACPRRTAGKKITRTNPECD